MAQKKVRNGVLSVGWIFGVLALGTMVGMVVSWMIFGTKESVPAQAPPPQVIVVQGAHSAKMPVFPEKDPQYPLRNLSHVDDYQQLGVLKSVDGSEPIALPLFGRRMANRPDRWEYYTATDKQNMLRVPIMVENRDCSEDVGCNEVYKGDQVMVPVYDKMFEAQLYKYAMSGR